MVDFVYSVADNDGYLDYKLALKIASYHQLKEDFLSDFREYVRDESTIDADLLLQWLGY